MFEGIPCLVTGGTGLIGRQVVRLLAEAGAEVTSVSLDDLELRPDVRYLKGDLTDFAFCKQVVGFHTVVFHVAGIKGNNVVTQEQPASFFVPLLMMNTNVLDACRRTVTHRVVYVSTIGAYEERQTLSETRAYEGAPMDRYPGWAKRMGELQCQAYGKQYGLRYVTVRPCSVYGPGDNFDPLTAMVIPALMAKIARGDSPLVVWGDGSAVRDFCYSEDVARGILLAAIKKSEHTLFNLGSGKGYSIGELVMALHGIVAFDHEWDTSKLSGVARRVLSITRAREELGWEPRVGLEEGLWRTWTWFQEHRDEYERKATFFEDVGEKA